MDDAGGKADSATGYHSASNGSARCTRTPVRSRRPKSCEGRTFAANRDPGPELNSLAACAGRADPQITERFFAGRGQTVAPSTATVLIFMRDDVTLLVRHILEREGYLALSAGHVAEARELIEHGRVDLVILDMAVVEQHRDARAYLRDLARSAVKPLLLLAADRGLSQEILPLHERHCIEVLRNPLSPDQLIACVEFWARKREAPGRTSNLAFGDVRMDLQTYRIHRNGRRVSVGPVEFRLLYHLLSRSPMVLSREELIEAAWPRQVHVEPRTVDVHIGRLRRQLNKRGEPNIIRTVRSAGYSLDYAN